MKGLLALPFTLPILASGARAEIILSLAPGAACRTEQGVKRASGVVPKPGAAAHRAANGMIATDEPVEATGKPDEDAHCYLYRGEVRLDAEPGQRPSAAVAGPSPDVPGTAGTR